MKKLLLLMMFLFSFLPLVSGADIYVAYDFTFEFDTPSSIYVVGAQCVDNDCTDVNSNSIELFHGNDFEVCYSNFQADSDANAFLSCVAGTKLSSNVVDLSDMDFVVIKEDTTVPFGSLIQFFASGDSYRPYDYKSFGFNCDYDVCIDPDAKLVPFTKVHNVIAEIQQLNVKNIDDETKPIQVEIPVEIEETVCSAFTFVNPERYRFEAPLGYSDYSANTRVTLDITNFNTGASYLHQAINIPIEADTCAGLAAFSWTPSASLENVEIKFRGETDVIDNQAASSIKDWAEVVETIYPSNLDGTCWTRAYDFTLSNEATTDLTTSLAQIEVGESLFANVMVGAWRDDSLTPMDYQLDVYFSNDKYYTHTGTTSGNAVSLVSFDLTNVISGLGAGQYPVKLVSTPLGSNCDIAEPVIQTQNLQILPAQEYKVSFYVRDEENNYLQNAKINFELIEADNNYVVDPVYDRTQNTNILGKTVFENVIPGDYVYTVSKNSFVSVTKTVHIGADSQIYVTLPEMNSAPRIELPDSFTVYYKDVVEFDMRNYVSDFNDAYDDLTFNDEVLSGNADVYHFGSDYVISTTVPNHAKIKFTVVDPAGARDYDIVDVYFINNEQPEVLKFVAEPDNGEVDFTTYFAVEVKDAENDVLTCTIEFGDGQSVTDLCDSIDGVSHTYTRVGTFNAVLTVKDSVSDPKKAYEQVFVYAHEFELPHIDFFSLDSSNGKYVPTNLDLNWKVSHPDNLAMDCTLRINGVSHAVSCNGNFDIDNFNKLGESRFTIVAVDSNGNQALRHIDKTFEKMESLPIISIFSANPDLGYGSLNSYFTIVAYDTDGDDLTCTLDFGDGSSEVSDSCEDLNGISHLYTNVGVYNVNLRVTDGDNEVFDSLQVEVKVPTDSKPKVISFTLDSSNGGFVPTDLTFNWKAIHPYSKPMTCTLYINNDNYNVPCEGSFNKYDYGIEGLGVFTIKADDGMYSDSRIIQKTFVKKHEEEKPPVIDLFVVSPSYGVEKLTSYFTIKVHDENGDALTCILDFGDLSIKVVDSCENLDGISHEYLVGDYNVQLTVKDGMFTVVDTAFVRVVEAADSKPVIEYFTLDSSNGYVVPTDLKFDWKVSHKYNKPMTCTLYVNSDSHIVPCVGSLTEFGYDIEGMGVFTLRATDGTYMDEKVIKKTFVRVNDLPVIDIFSANPKLGVGSLSSVFTVKVHDVNSDSLTCTLQFGDGSQVIDSCDNLDGVLHNYNNVGVYNAVLIVTDGKGASYAYERLEVVSIEDGSPVINWFIMSTETGDYTVSNNLTFNWDVSHPLGKSMICTLDINGDVNFIPCVGSLTEFDYDLVGQGVFTLRADDGMNSAQRVISQLFVPRDDENNTIDLSLDMISLIIDDVLVPGEFDFGIIVKNETLASRTLTFRPFITCNGVKAGLDEKDRYFDGYLDSHAISKSQRDENFVYAFKSDSRKYKAQIPTGTSCRFSVQVLDKYGTDIEVSKGVMFKYPEDARSAQSIRGNGLDIMNYMNSVVTNSIQKGYNSIEFDIENKDGITRDISITMISRELGINYHVEAKLGPGQRKNIQIPLFIDGDVEAGKYLLRLGVNDGSDKQVRYTKVNIN